MYYACIIYVLYNACIKFLYLCVYGAIDLFCNHVIFRATAHEITARNGANSKHNSHNDEDDVRDWHPTFLLHCRGFLYFIRWIQLCLRCVKDLRCLHCLHCLRCLRLPPFLLSQDGTFDDKLDDNLDNQLVGTATS